MKHKNLLLPEGVSEKCTFHGILLAVKVIYLHLQSKLAVELEFECNLIFMLYLATFIISWTDNN